MYRFKPKYLSVSPESGQLAVGLAFAFAGILAMFGLVFQFSLNTREKMNLQTTTDYAALLAADVQRHNLNRVHELNKRIETEWYTLESIILQPHCSGLMGIVGNSLPAVSAAVSSFVGSNAAVPSTLEPESGEAGICDQLCDQFDKKSKDISIQSYKLFHSQAKSAILSSIFEANGMANDRVMDTFLSPRNLPHGLYMQLQSTLGQDYSIAAVRDQYANGALSNEKFAYEILDTTEVNPLLFFPYEESRTTYHMDYTYADIPCPTTGTCACTPAVPMTGTPKFTSLPFRVTRDFNYKPTHFMTGIKYSPPPSIIEKMLNLGVKNPDTQSEKFGEDLAEGSNKIKLFARKVRSIYAVAAAKPFGGEYPNSGDITGSPIALIQNLFNGNTENFSVFGTSGQKFEGAKLMGIADKEELDGFRMDTFDNCIAKFDNDGNVIGCIPYYAEDFLH